MDILQEIEKEGMKENLPEYSPGDLVRVYSKIIEGEKTRIQRFQGTIIQRRGSGLRSTITVRKVTEGIGVERIIPIHSPFITKIEILKKGKVRRAKLYYLRDRVGKAARVKEKRE